jgi:hypothetical protein
MSNRLPSEDAWTFRGAEYGPLSSGKLALGRWNTPEGAVSGAEQWLKEAIRRGFHHASVGITQVDELSLNFDAG